MDYEKIYHDLIKKRLREKPIGYSEKHHIIPRCLGGSDEKSNIVSLTAKEHFIAHLLLTKFYDENTVEYKKMVHAFNMMRASSSNQNRYFSSRSYSKLKGEYSLVMSELMAGSKNSQFGKIWIYNLDKRECKKINSGEKLDDGWFLGRVVDFDNHHSNKKCSFCGKIGLQNKLSKFCSLKCRKECRMREHKMFGMEDQFMAYYKTNGSMNRSLIMCGVKQGAVGHYYDWAKKVVDERSIIDDIDL